MGLFGRLKEPPKVPAGGRAFVDMSTDEPPEWCVRYNMPDQTPDFHCPKISPPFKHQVNAYAWLDWVNGGAPFVYPEGEA